MGSFPCLCFRFASSAGSLENPNPDCKVLLEVSTSCALTLFCVGGKSKTCDAGTSRPNSHKSHQNGAH
jgi:hypothetical protein